MNDLTFSDLFEEIKLEIFKYLNLDDRVQCRYVCREWYSILSRLSSLQQTISIGQPEFDSNDRMKLSLCNINSRHRNITSFNTISTNVLNGLMWVDTNNTSETDHAAGGEEAISQLLKSFKSLRSVFIYAPVRVKLSDLPDTVEHIHFGHNVENAIVFDKTTFPKLTCISTIDAHLDDLYLHGITNLLRAQKFQLENVSVCEVPRLLCEQIIEMRRLKQLYVFDFKSDFDSLYKQKDLEIMDAHPALQYFNMFVCVAPRLEQLCPTANIRWLVEFGSAAALDRNFVIDVFDVMPFESTLEFAKEYTHGLHLVFLHDTELTRYESTLNNLKDLRLTYHGWIFTEDTLRLSLEHHLAMAPNLRSLQVRFFADGFFDKEQWMPMILSVVCVFAQKHSSRAIMFELSALGKLLLESSHWPCFPKNLNVTIKSLKAE